MNTYDFLIIGSGLAGLNAALTVPKTSKVIIVTKSKAFRSSTNWAQGGIVGVISKSDSTKKHIADTMVAGCFHNNQKAVTYLSEHSKAAIEKLRNFGVPFATNKDDSLQLTREGGHQERRIAFVGDHTGKSIEETMLKQIKKNPNITVLEYCPAIKLLVSKNKCYGVQVIRNNKIENIIAYNTVIATGGLGQIYQNTTNPSISTGDGIALGAIAGCETNDLEYIQFHPTALNQKKGTKFLLSEALRGEGAILRNHKGQDFMKKYHPLKELAPRDIVARSIYKEQASGPVYLDLRHLPKKETQERFPQISSKLKKIGLFFHKDLIPITPSAHYLCGGLKVDLNGKTNIKNLYAFGEVACTGVHGANRLASNSLLEAVVFSNNIKNVPPSKTFSSIPSFTKEKQLPPSTFRSKLNRIRRICRKTMWEKVGIIRTSKDLVKAAQILQKLEAELKLIKGTSAYIAETRSIITCALLVTQAALNNTTSLGAHYLEEASF